ncbi:hypothetical protein ACNOYE_31160 [Nannocystaceae bacterium ST9]
MSGRSGLLALLVVLLLTALGCAPAPGNTLQVDPGTIRFTPDHTRATIAIHNPSPLGRPIRDVRFSGPDWDALRFVDDELPSALAGHDVALVTIELSPGKFLAADRKTWREGHATLEFDSDRDSHAIAIEFAPQAEPRGSTALAILIAIGLTLAAGGFVLARERRAAAASSAGDRLGLALAFTGLFASAALLPLGPAWCSDRLALAVGPIEAMQCRAGLGGHALIGWAADPGMAWLLLALTTATIGAATFARARAAQLAARLIGFGLLIAALVASLGADDPGELIAAQQRTLELGTLPLPRLGLLIQPLAFVLALLFVADAGEREPARSLAASILARLEDLVWSALIVVLFLGAGFVPGLTDRPLPVLLHGSEIAIATLAFVAKLALVVFAVRRLRARPRATHARGSAAPHQSRTLVTLALINLLVSVSWLAMVRIFG